MMSAFFDNPAAFSPMFSDRVKIHAPRPEGDINGTFRACVMPIAFADPFADVSAQSEVRKYSILLANSGAESWLESALGSKPQIGDVVELDFGVSAAVYKISPIADAWYEMEAREC